MERSQTPKGKRARERILAAAERLIAARGFYGTSMRDIAAAARLPLATTVYHFAKKEQIYAAVLGAIADDLDTRLQVALAEQIRDPLDALAVALVRWSAAHPSHVKLLLREVLDNPARVANASRLPLAPFLAKACALLASRGAPQPEVAVLHLVGAISYFVAAWPTVERIVGAARAKQITAAYEREAIAFAQQILPPALPKRRTRPGAAT